MIKNFQIRNSTTDFLIFQKEHNSEHIEVKVENEMIWISQKMMSKLFEVSLSTINEHIKHVFELEEQNENRTIRNFRIVQKEGTRDVERSIEFYNLDVIISVGYKVNSQRAIEFRKWATQVIKQFSIKGYIIDKQRLENGKILSQSYFDELLIEIKEIRLSERNFYQKLTDIYSTSLDYDKTSQSTIDFFKKVQNKMHYAIHGHTASELIHTRADSQKKNMGLTSWKNAPDGKIIKTDVSIAKNYLNRQELESMGRIVSAYLDLAEERAKRKIPMTMQNWSKRLDLFLEFDDREILENPGKITMEIAKDKAESEFKKYRVYQDKVFESDFDKMLKESHELEYGKKKN